GFRFDVDQSAVSTTLSRLLVELSEDHSWAVQDVEVRLNVQTSIPIEDLEVVNRELKARYKELRSEIYERENKTRKSSKVEPVEEISEDLPEPLNRIDFGL